MAISADEANLKAIKIIINTIEKLRELDEQYGTTVNRNECIRLLEKDLAWLKAKKF